MIAESVLEVPYKYIDYTGVFLKKKASILVLY